MKRTLASLCILFVLAGPVFAQKTLEPIALTLSPAELPQTSLKYRLFPERGQLTDGNAPTQYYRALSLFVENQPLLGELKADYWDNWLAMPLKELPRKEIEDKLRFARHLLRELEVGSKRKQCDWQLENRSEGIGLLIPDVQGFRLVIRPLALRARLKIAEGNYEAACETLQTGYALAHHLCRGPTFIHVLVGKHLSHIMTTQLETLLQQPDAPNLYWALTVMPKPFADLQPALYQETLWIENMFPWLKKLEGTPMSEAQIKAAEGMIEKSLQEFGVRKAAMGDRVGQALYLTQVTAEAKRELVGHYNLSSEQVAAMPSFQVAALYSFREYKESAEEIMKWAYVPEGYKYPDCQAAMERNTNAWKRLDHLYFRGLLGGLGGNGQVVLEKVSLAAAHIDRRFAALRCVEAIRQYAARHEGLLPMTLADMKDLPIPSDPLTGKPFLYAAEGDKATLALPKPTEEKPNPNQVLTYHLTMKRDKK